MSKFLVVVALVAFGSLCACGGSDAPPVTSGCTVSTDCDDGQKCVQKKCVDPGCWSDNDCEKTFRCDTVNNVCVEKPECFKDEDCPIVDYSQLVCDPNTYKCVSYLTRDPYYKTTCDGTSTRCGDYTYCSNGVCEDVCRVNQNKYWDTYTKSCEGKVNKDACLLCYCWVELHSKVDTQNNVCLPPTTPRLCKAELASGFKNQLENNDWDSLERSFSWICN